MTYTVVESRGNEKAGFPVLSLTRASVAQGLAARVSLSAMARHS